MVEADITTLLNAAGAGDAIAREQAYTRVYAELKRCAQRQKNVVAGSSLTSTALVHELFLRLTQRHAGTIENRAHFFALAARAMRQIIVDHARTRFSQKRGGALITGADKGLDVSAQSAEQALELDAALTRLESRDADLARIVEWHFFAGLSFEEIGDQLGCHARTVERDWALARMLLRENIAP